MQPIQVLNKTILSAIIIASFFLFSLYHTAIATRYSLYLANRALADTAIILITLSFALSGIAFFWKKATKFLPYRRELGVVGFVFPFPDYFLSMPLPFVFSTITVLIYTTMVIVSNFGVPAKIGGIMWRRLLRVGYIGVLFTIFHFGIQQFGSWKFWLQQPFDSPPPSSFIMLIVSIATLLLRIVLIIALPKKPHPLPRPVDSTKSS